MRVYGCPAEEGGSGKAYMAREGLFDDVDAAFTWHPATMNAVATGSNQANIQAAFTFTGQASHAAASPEKGRSALDAVELMNVGVNYLREHMADYERVHYAVLDTGGVSPNVVQEHAEVLYLIRSKSNAEAKRLYERVQKIAQGAALMTETSVSLRLTRPYQIWCGTIRLQRLCMKPWWKWAHRNARRKKKRIWKNSKRPCRKKISFMIRV